MLPWGWWRRAHPGGAVLQPTKSHQKPPNKAGDGGRSHENEKDLDRSSQRPVVFRLRQGDRVLACNLLLGGLELAAIRRSGQLGRIICRQIDPALERLEFRVQRPS